MIVYNGTLIDLKTTITNIANISVSRSTWGIEQFVQEALVHYAPQIYSYVYTDLRGNIRINKNALNTRMK